MNAYCVKSIFDYVIWKYNFLFRYYLHINWPKSDCSGWVSFSLLYFVNFATTLPVSLPGFWNFSFRMAFKFRISYLGVFILASLCCKSLGLYEDQIGKLDWWVFAPLFGICVQVFDVDPSPHSLMAGWADSGFMFNNCHLYTGSSHLLLSCCANPLICTHSEISIREDFSKRYICFRNWPKYGEKSCEIENGRCQC